MKNRFKKELVHNENSQIIHPILRQALNRNGSGQAQDYKVKGFFAGHNKNNRKKAFFLLKLIPIGITLITIFYLVFFSNLLRIEDLIIENDKADCISNEDITSLSKLLGNNILFLEKNLFEKQLINKFPCVKKTEISWSIPKKVVIKIYGRNAAVILNILKLPESESTTSAILGNSISEGTSSSKLLEATSSSIFNFHYQEKVASFISDDEGFIFSDRVENLNIPEIYITAENIPIGKQIENNLIKNSINIINNLKSYNLNSKRSEIFEDYLLIDDNPKIAFSLKKDVSIQLGALQLILNKAKIDSEKLEFVDLRFDKPVIKYTPEKKDGER